MNPNGASTQNPNYATDPKIVEAARTVMGGIDLDPCTTAEVNSWHVRASSIITPPYNGLHYQWPGRVFCNPPGGQSNDAVAWWEHGLQEFAEGRCTEFFYVSFSLDRLQTSQRRVPLTAFATYIPSARVPYLHHDDGAREVKRKRKGVEVIERVEYRAGEVDPQPPKPSCFTWVTRRANSDEILRAAFVAQGYTGIVVRSVRGD